MRYRYFLSAALLVFLTTRPAVAQTAAPADTAAFQAAAATAPPRSSPQLPWWLPNARECAAIRAEEARAAPRQAQRREKQLRRWGAEQPEPAVIRPD